MVSTVCQEDVSKTSYEAKAPLPQTRSVPVVFFGVLPFQGSEHWRRKEAPPDRGASQSYFAQDADKLRCHRPSVLPKARDGLDFLKAVAGRSGQNLDRQEVSGLGHAPKGNSADAEKFGRLFLIEKERSVARKTRSGPALDQVGKNGALMSGQRAVGRCDGLKQADTCGVHGVCFPSTK